MPDHRLRGATAYSTNKSTQANRKRLSSMAPEQRATYRKKISEYQALWQLLNRVSRKEEYKRANRGTQRAMLENSARALMEKRRREGKTMCQTDEQIMIERHLKKEAGARALTRQSNASVTLPNLKGVAIDPFPHANPLSPPATPDEEGFDGGNGERELNDLIDFDADLKFENEGQNGDEEQAGGFDTELDAQLKSRSRALTTHGIISALRSQVRSLRTEVRSLRTEMTDLQLSVQGYDDGGGAGFYGDQCSTMEREGSHYQGGIGFPPQMYHFQPTAPAIQPVWTTAPKPHQQQLQHAEHGEEHGHGQNWEVLGRQEGDQEDEQGDQTDGGQGGQQHWVLLGP